VTVKQRYINGCTLTFLTFITRLALSRYQDLLNRDVAMFRFQFELEDHTFTFQCYMMTSWFDRIHNDVNNRELFMQP
jgi:uncharacterized membrane protein